MAPRRVVARASSHGPRVRSPVRALCLGIDYNNHTIPHNAPAIFCVHDWHRDQEPVLEQGYATDLIADEAVRLISRQTKDQPFFHYVAFNAIQGPSRRSPATPIGLTSDPRRSSALTKVSVGSSMPSNLMALPTIRL